MRKNWQQNCHCVSHKPYCVNFRSALKSELPSHAVNTVRGKGLFNAIVVSEGFDAWDICVEVTLFCTFKLRSSMI